MNKDQDKYPASQIPLSFEIESATGHDDLIISSSVQAAIGIVEQWPDWVSYLVILAGPIGSGKSHIANIWHLKTKARTITLDLPTEDIIKYAKTNPLLIEDIDQQIKQENFDESKLFHIFNAAKQARTHILMTTRTQPISWDIQLPDLISRLKAAIIVEIGEPDEALLRQVIYKLFADRQVDISEKIVNYLVLRMERSLAVAHHIVAEMDHLALSRQVAVSRSLAAEVLSQIEKNSA